MSRADAAARLVAIADALSIGRLDRHIVLCAEQTVPRCASFEQTAEVWRYLKGRCKELDLASAPPIWRGERLGPAPATESGSGSVLRTKADCLRICEQGPIAVVYPDGTWYHSVTIEVMERIITEHLVDGHPVTEYVFAIDPLVG